MSGSRLCDALLARHVAPHGFLDALLFLVGQCVKLRVQPRIFQPAGAREKVPLHRFDHIRRQPASGGKNARHAVLLSPYRAIYRLRNLFREFILFEYAAELGSIGCQPKMADSIQKAVWVFAGVIFHGFSPSRLGNAECY